jgi:riboflavin kinase/FMN adenylyltransferase
VGTNPTFAGTERRVESYVMDHGHDLDLYGRSVRVQLVSHLRPMVAYRGVDALVEQMHADVEQARAALA